MDGYSEKFNAGAPGRSKRVGSRTSVSDHFLVTRALSDASEPTVTTLAKAHYQPSGPLPQCARPVTPHEEACNIPLSEKLSETVSTFSSFWPFPLVNRRK
jgi:hypothetical protein